MAPADADQKDTLMPDQKTAHLCLVIDPSGPTPVITGAGIFGAGPMLLTQGNSMVFAELFWMPADTYDEAKKLVEQYLDHPNMAWVRALLPKAEPASETLVAQERL